MLEPTVSLRSWLANESIPGSQKAACEVTLRFNDPLFLFALQDMVKTCVLAILQLQVLVSSSTKNRLLQLWRDGHYGTLSAAGKSVSHDSRHDKLLSILQAGS